MKTPILKNDVLEHRYEIHIDGTMRGYIEYHRFADVLIVTHTEIMSALEGQGHGTELARMMLDDVRSRRQHVVPVCGFFAHCIRKNPAYHELVTPTARRIFHI